MRLYIRSGNGELHRLKVEFEGIGMPVNCYKHYKYSDFRIT